MFAVIKTGGKQYKVTTDEIVIIEKLDVEPGQEVSFDEVLMVGGDAVKIGAPTVPGAKVTGQLMEQIQGEKVIIFKKRRRHNYRRKRGHRQELSVVKIQAIEAGA